MQYASPVECDVPMASALQPRLVAAACFCDSYRAPLTPPPAGVVEIFFSIFGNHPRWIKQVLVLRNRLAKPPAWSCRPFVSYTTGPEKFTFSSSFHSIGGESNTSSAERGAQAGCEARSLHAHFGAAILGEWHGRQHVVGGVVSLLIVLSLAGKLHPVELPAKYKATYARENGSPSTQLKIA